MREADISGIQMQGCEEGWSIKHPCTTRITSKEHIDAEQVKSNSSTQRIHRQSHSLVIEYARLRKVGVPP